MPKNKKGKRGSNRGSLRQEVLQLQLSAKATLQGKGAGGKNGAKGESGASDDDLASDVLSHYSSASESASVMEEGTGAYTTHSVTQTQPLTCSIHTNEHRDAHSRITGVQWGNRILLEYITEIAKTRLAALESLRQAFSSKLLCDFLLERRLTLSDCLERSLRKGGGEEQAAAANVCALLCVQLGGGDEGEEGFRTLRPILSSILSDSCASIAARQSDLVKSLSHLESIFTSSYPNHEGTLPTPKAGAPGLHCAALQAWALLVTLCPASHLTTLLDIHLPKLQACLECSDVNYRIAVGETIALLFELGRDIDQNEDFTEEKIRFGVEGIYIDSWIRRRIYDAFKEVLESGVRHHLQYNQLLRDIFELGQPLILDASVKASRISRFEKMQTEPESISAVFREFSQFPTPVSVTVCPEVPANRGTRYINLCTEWSQNETIRGVRLRYNKQYTLQCDDRAVQSALPPGHCSYVQGELLSSYSPSGTLKAVIRETNSQGKGQHLDLTALKKHGRVYEDAQFGSLAWSACEGRVVYVAERSRSKAESSEAAKPGPAGGDEGAGHYREETSAGKEDRSVYQEDWGEGLAGKSAPVLCVADVDKSTVSVLQGVPTQVSPGQALWSPGDEGVLFVGWRHEPFRLGLRFCSNRSCKCLASDFRSALFHVDLEGNCECLSSDSSAVSSPRLSPDRRYIVYLQGQVFGPHNQCLSLQMYDWATKRTSLLVDVVKRPQEGTICTVCAQEVFVVDRCTKRVTCLVDNEEFGSWKLLAIERDLMKVGFLPPAGGEAGVSWTALDEPRQIPHLEWRVLNITPVAQEENAEYSGLDFGALLVKPRVPRSGVKVPLVVFAHVNFRGSTGFGQDSILSLIGNIGNQDVKDVQRAVLTALQSDTTLDPNKVAVMGGSHGGFLACHMIGQYPDFYRAYALTAMFQVSPIAHASQIKTPVLLMLGGKDKRVSPHQGLELYRALKSRNSPIRLLWFAEDGHSLAKVDTQADCFLNVVLWFLKHLDLQ
ncbi:hypothetical protein JZ751_014558 [Albula glossodonta]|uniref:acylaminoacyl-peptidase n=1 Tax=Albula glossodonta TaxID=121402 RepID=A0A8T2MZ33_9TELE|nr:hypothetical protein JZ751_014558 [Albula glossodonta]